MSRPIIARASPRLFLNTPLRPARLPRRALSSTSSSNHQNLNSKNTFADRALVLGLLTITTLIGVGIGTRSKCQKNQSLEIDQNTKDSESKKSSTDSNNQKQTTAKNTADNESENPSENSEQGAFNPETGEINWGCPCLGGMAHGTCGEQFKAAFSCFVYSEQEPKGVECIEKFKEMQDCFREHPEEYGPELADSEDSTPDDDQGPSPDATGPEDDLVQPAESQTEERELAARPLTTHASDSPMRKEVEEGPLTTTTNSNSSSSAPVGPTDSVTPDLKPTLSSTPSSPLPTTTSSPSKETPKSD